MIAAMPSLQEYCQRGTLHRRHAYRVEFAMRAADARQRYVAAIASPSNETRSHAVGTT